MSRKTIGIGLILLGFIGAAVMVLSNDGRSPRSHPVPSSASSSSETNKTLTNRDQTPSVQVVPVILKQLEETIPLPGELLPFLRVDLLPKITGIVESVAVDRGARVKKGDLLIQLTAPELRAQRLEAEAQLQGAIITYTRLRSAATTPGVVAGNDLELAQHHQDALRARLQSLQEMEKYLQVVAPFDGIITERNIHPGAVVGPEGDSHRTSPLLRLEQMKHLRLIVPVPEVYAGSIAKGATVPFTVPAFPQETFTGVVSRISQSVDPKTRTMPCEIDVMNTDHRLAAGMFPEIRWPIRRSTPTMFVPTSAIVTTTEDVFVLRVKDHLVQWVPVRKGSRSGSTIEVFGNLQSGDFVVLRGTDEMRPGTRVKPMASQ